MSRVILVQAPFKDDCIQRIKDAAGDEFTFERLPDNCDEVSLKDALSRAEIVVGQPPIELLQNPEVNCPNLRLIQMMWAGMDQYTLSELPFPHDRIKLINASGAYGGIISQYILGQIIALMTNFKGYYNQQRDRVWQRIMPSLGLDNARVLIFGAGDIGSTTAKRLKAFDAYTIGVCRDVTRSREYFDELCTLSDAEKYIPDVDVIVCCMPNSSETMGYFDRRRLEMISSKSVIVNVGRGTFIDCMALNDLLSEGRIWGAALDVTNPEPLPQNHPLWDNSRCIITPHSSGVAFGDIKATEDKICDIACKNIREYIG